MHGESRQFTGGLVDDVAALVLVVRAAGDVVYANAAAEKVLGGERGARADGPADVCCPDALRRCGDREGRPGPIEIEHEVAGSIRRIAWVRKVREDGHTVWTGCDVTSHQAEQQSLREREALHQLVLSSISDAVFITDDVGDLTFICPNVEVIFGYTYDEVRAGGNIAGLLGTAALAGDELAESGEIANVEQRIVDKHGQEHILLVNIKRVSIGGGTRLYTCRDVTARRRIEEALREYEAELAHATRLSTVGEMTAGLAHELSQPLAAISNYSQACLHKLKVSDDGREIVPHLEQVSSQAHRAAEIIRRVRSFARKRPVPRISVNVEELLSEAMQLARPMLRRHRATVEVRQCESLPPVEVDATGIQQVLINLVSNALEAVEGLGRAGRVEIVAALDNDREIVIGVHDNGPGLSAELAEQVYEAFYTTKPEGMGLGLAISRSLVQRSGGRLWFEANADGGTTFRFTLPVMAVAGTLDRR